MKKDGRKRGGEAKRKKGEREGKERGKPMNEFVQSHFSDGRIIMNCTLLFIDEFAIFRVLTHLVPYLKIQRILVNELTSMTPKSKNTCRKLRVSAFKWY